MQQGGEALHLVQLQQIVLREAQEGATAVREQELAL